VEEICLKSLKKQTKAFADEFDLFQLADTQCATEVIQTVRNVMKFDIFIFMFECTFNHSPKVPFKVLGTGHT